MSGYQDNTGPTQAPAYDSEAGAGPAYSPGQKQTPRDSAFGLDSGYVTRNKDVLGLDETAPAHTDFGTGSGTGTHTHSTGTGTGTGQDFGGSSDIGSGSGYGGSSGTRQPPHFGEAASDAELMNKYGGSGVDSSAGHTSTAAGTTGPGVTPPDAETKKGGVKGLMNKVTHAIPHRTKAPFDQGPSTGPQAHTPMSRAVAGGSHPVGGPEHALPHLSHGIPETAQSQGAVSHNKTKLKSLQQD